MVQYNYAESDYRFRSPIRYFTANDPYYWEVDNIPLQQLMENDLWLRDQMNRATNATGFSREDFNELKPYVNGTDNKVYVMPGRFTARINDIASSARFMTLRRIAGELFNEATAWEVGTYNTTSIQSNIDAITSESEFSPTFLNGLMERAFTYAAKDPFNAYIDYRSQTTTFNSVFPIKDIAFWANRVDTELWTSNWLEYQPDVGMAADTTLQSLFMKYWRGVVRTSVVDVPTELEIEIPPFNIADFDYIDADGNRQSRPSAEIRIDLLFAYSRPVDALETRVIDTHPNSTTGYRIINKAELGIVKGAGGILNISARGVTGPVGTRGAAPITDGGGADENGVAQIVADVGDSKTVVGGFDRENVRGSFPSPDDLMNVAPLISEKLEYNDPYLLGQSVLPIAYIAVRKDPDINEAGVQILSTSSVIDIRPFFRTAELTYSERAGIAAAVPQISISNPVVSKLELRYETKRLFDDYQARFNALGGNSGGSSRTETFPRIVGAGYVMGGTLFGPEATIQHLYETELGGSPTQAQLNSTFLARHGYRSDLVIPEYPDWDLARFITQPGATRSNITNPGQLRNDRINSYHRGHRNGPSEEESEFGFWDTNARLNRIKLFATDAFQGNVDINFVKKSINLNRDSVAAWMDDYIVNAQFLNCVPLSTRYNADNQRVFGGASDIWIHKERNRFTIYVAWATAQSARDSDSPINNRTRNMGGFAVLTDELYSRRSASNTRYPSEASIGVASYPTVTFEVVGIPTGFAGMPTSLAGASPTIRLT